MHHIISIYINSRNASGTSRDREARHTCTCRRTSQHVPQGCWPRMQVQPVRRQRYRTFALPGVFYGLGFVNTRAKADMKLATAACPTPQRHVLLCCFRRRQRRGTHLHRGLSGDGKTLRCPATPVLRHSATRQLPSPTNRVTGEWEGQRRATRSPCGIGTITCTVKLDEGSWAEPKGPRGIRMNPLIP